MLLVAEIDEIDAKGNNCLTILLESPSLHGFDFNCKRFNYIIGVFSDKIY